MPTTFKVSDVERWGDSLFTVPTVADALEYTRGIHGVVASETNLSGICPTLTNPFVGAFHNAFDLHCPLVLSPDDVWLAILQGLTLHIRENAETLRSRFVSHDGKMDIIATLNETDEGLDWKGGVRDLSLLIRGHIGPETHDLLVGSFSTTGDIERMVGDITLMDAMGKYMDYNMVTACGIPEITLLGEPNDWRQIRDRARMLVDYDLDWWTTKLVPVLSQFVRASEGDVDVPFWERAYKLQEDSGGPYIGGWVSVFFPYLNSTHRLEEEGGKVSWPRRLGRSKWLDSWHNPPKYDGPTFKDYPVGMSDVPWTWLHCLERIPMRILGGFMAVSQDPVTSAVRPMQGYAVVDPRVKPVKMTREERREKMDIAMKIMGLDEGSYERKNKRLQAERARGNTDE